MTMLSPNNYSRILFIITQGIWGGAQIHVRDLTEHLVYLGYDVHVAIGVEGSLIDELESSGIKVHHVPSLIRELSIIADIKAYHELYSLIKNLKPDIVTIHSSKAGILGRLACRRQNIPNVFTAHGWAFTEGVSNGKRKFYIKIERLAAKWTNHIICVSDYDRQLALNYSVASEVKLRTIHNGIPLIEDTNIAYPDKGNVVNIIMVARFSEPKDQKQLLDALYNLDCRDRCLVRLVGDGENLAATKSHAIQLKLTNVEFLGTRTDVINLLSQASIFVLSSNWEGFPLTILEAMRAGLPVVASDVGGVSEAVVDGQTGYLIPRGDAKYMAHCLEKLINNPELRVDMGKKARERFMQNFTIREMIEKTIAVYDEVWEAKEID